MSTFYLGASTFLFLNILAGLWRALRGPEPADRLMAAQLFGTTVAAIMLLQAEGTGIAELRDVALVFASLAVVAIVAFVRLAWPDEPVEEDP